MNLRNHSPSTPSSSPEILIERIASLADPARLRMLHLLAGQELAVSELAEVLQMPQSSVSRHLKLLAGKGWVVSRGEGTANFYQMANGELPQGARQLWQVAADESRDWPALAHDRLRLTRCLAARSGTERDYFAGVAGEWERLRTELYGETFTGLAFQALLAPDWVIADLACGSGAAAIALAPWVARVIAVDRSPEMLQAARRNAHGIANLQLEEGDLEALPIADATCDAALMLLALTQVEEPALAVAEMARVVKPGGRAVVVDLLHHDREEFRRRMGQKRLGFAPGELESLLLAAGFDAVRCSPLAPESEAKGPALLLASGTRSIRPQVSQRNRKGIAR
ncbi:MAG: metalloregulator ArsR/SmtB family transcription factor [Thermoanaerobaculia bacterium]